MPDQIVDEKDTIPDERFDVVSKFPLLLIDWNEEEVNDLDIVTRPIENRMIQWVDAQISQLKAHGVVLTYSELIDELEIEIDSGIAIAPAGETSKSPPTTKSRKRKYVSERQPKNKVYIRKTSKGESLSKNAKKSRGFSEMPTIEEDPQHEGEEEVEQPNSPPSTSTPAITVVVATPPPLTF